RAVDLAGGKGVNVARALAGLGEPALALLPLGGPPGAETADLARREGLAPIVVPIAGRTRTALTIREESTGSYWHYLEPGPEWDPADSERLRQAYQTAVERCELVAISGSLPGAPAEPPRAPDPCWPPGSGRSGRRCRRPLSRSTPWAAATRSLPGSSPRSGAACRRRRRSGGASPVAPPMPPSGTREASAALTSSGSCRL